MHSQDTGGTRQRGAAVLGRGLRRAGIYRWFVITGGAEKSKGRESPLDIECDRLSVGNIDEYFAFRPEQSRVLIRRRFEAGEWCFGGRHEGRLVTATWSCPGRARLEFAPWEIRLTQGAYYNHDTYVMGGFRGQRVADVLARFRGHFMRDAGYDFALGLFDPENLVATQRSKTRRNLPLGRLDCVRLGPWQWLRLTLDPDASNRRVEGLVRTDGMAGGSTGAEQRHFAQRSDGAQPQ